MATGSFARVARQPTQDLASIINRQPFGLNTKVRTTFQEIRHIDPNEGLLGFGDSHCDFIVFNDTDFCFVELKLNAISLNKVNQNRNKGVKQLSNTIDYLMRN